MGVPAVLDTWAPERDDGRDVPVSCTILHVRAMPCIDGIGQIGRRCGTTRHCPSRRPCAMAEFVRGSSRAEKEVRSTRRRATLPVGSGAKPPRATFRAHNACGYVNRVCHLPYFGKTAARLRYIMYGSDSSARTV